MDALERDAVKRSLSYREAIDAYLHPQSAWSDFKFTAGFYLWAAGMLAWLALVAFALLSLL
jgi:hypothetical protein